MPTEVDVGLNTNALTTIDKARIWVKRQTGSNAQDDILVGAINGVSTAIESYCLREFHPTPALDSGTPVTRRFLYGGKGWLSLAPYELRSLGGAGFGGTGSIVLYSDLPSSAQDMLAAGTSSVEGEYRLGPRQKTRQGTYLWMTAPRYWGYPVLNRSWLPSGSYGLESEVTISGYWGMTTIPADVEMACWIAIANVCRNPEGFATRNLGELTFSEPAEVTDQQEALPLSARLYLRAYKRPKPMGMAL
jgi:hypothetical protein